MANKNVPLHVSIIPDGNRRWAKNKRLKPWEGHQAAGSKEHMLSLLDEAQKIGISYLTFWGFSTENWNRDKKEIDQIFSLISDVLRNFEKELVKRKIRFRHLGRRDRIPDNIVQQIERLEKLTQDFDKCHLQLCLDYGGRDELTRAINGILKSGVTEITEKDVSRYLDTNGIPDPDLIIRTSGEQRLSGFMPFQSSYAEFYFTPIHFPEFGPEELREAVQEFGRRKRNFGV